ncbi:YSIRK-type signal peptide-containing protein [Streptococcus sp. 4886]|uniref:YSIRK-type signal peptide-containing protein n=1 Tax=Streptococcus sp. 4886 TaxID=2582682 RepID=UPI0031F494D9
MEKKSPMSRVERLHREKVTRYSIRKYSFGAASVAVAALFMFLGNGAVSANELSKQDTPDVEALAPALDAPSTPAESVPAAQPVVEEPTKPAAAEVTTPALDKKQLENYISEVKSKLSAGKYANKTEESLALLNGELASAESTLASATSQDELTKAYQKLVTFVSSGLKNKAKDSKDAPKVDTTNGQPTVGKKAENTEKKSESNAIENTGSNDPRNEKEISKDNPFRTEATDTEGPVAEIPYSEGRNVYVYGGESEGFDIKIKDNSGVVANATIVRGGNQPFTAVSGETDILDVEFGYKANVFSTETPASESNPAVIHYTGLPGGTLNQKQLEDARTTGLNLGWRYVKATDKAGNGLRAIDERDDKPGALYVVVKPQTYKYNIQQPENNANKIAVSDINNLTETDIQKIKDQIKIGYSKTSQDARFESKKGQDLDNQASVVKSIDVNGQTITVTYNDDSTDTASISDVARTNNAPTVEIPFSDAATKQVYVYGGEENSFDIKFKDDSGKIKSAAVVQGGNNAFNKVEGEENKVDVEWGYTANFIDAETTATEDSPAIISYSGMPGGKLTNKQLETARTKGLVLGKRYATAADLDNAIIKNTARGNSFQTDPGAFEVVLKPQTQKYDIQTPAEADKVAVDDASDVSEAEFNKIKDKIKIEYSKNNIDARLADKKG